MKLMKSDLNSCTQKVDPQVGKEVKTWEGVPYYVS
jgi:hypothetical protein